MLNLGNSEAFLGAVYPLGNTIHLLGLLPISRKIKIYSWDLASTFLTEYTLALGTYWLVLGAVTLLGPYFWILESIACLLRSRNALTRHPHLRTKLGTAPEVTGVGEAAKEHDFNSSKWG